MEQTHLTTWVAIKNLAYFPAFLIGLSPESYGILSIFMLVDMVLGVARSGVLYGGRSIKSYKFTAGLISKLLVLSVPLIVVWAGKGAGIELTFIGQWAIGALVLSQAYSMLGHINAIRIGKDIKEWDAVSLVLQRLRKSLEVMLVDGHNKED